MFHLLLYQPEIPPNTGNVIRLCANVGAQLHLIRPLGFSMEDKRLRRAGLDYRELANVTEHDDLSSCLSALARPRLFAFSTKGTTRFDCVNFQRGDAFLFGPETRGLPGSLLASLEGDRVLRLPMQPNNRSLNLANAAAVVLYRAWGQLGFAGGD